jgi:xanthine dehydrogenase accessory factor
VTHWVSAVQKLRRERRPGVLVTVTDVRGHAPRDAGAKMVVALHPVVEEGALAPGSKPPGLGLDLWGTIGGGNLEETALVRARALLDAPPGEPESVTIPLTDKARTEHGRQCCGGEVTLLFEPLPVVPSVAIFGLGHVGLELARILARHDLDLHLVDSRKSYVAEERLACLDDGPAEVVVHHSPVPELALGEVPGGTHVLILTHDHAEDFALCDAALRTSHLGSIGLIGSSAKWRRFQQGLRVEGHPESAIARIQSPIGTPEIRGKDPAVIALSVAAQLLRTARVGVGRS